MKDHNYLYQLKELPARHLALFVPEKLVLSSGSRASVRDTHI